MSENLIKIGEPQAYWNAAGTRILKYSIELYHQGLKDHKLISAPEIDILERKVNIQIQKWEDKWEKITKKRRELEEKKANKETAERMTQEAQQLFDELENILSYTLSINDTIDWDSLKKYDEFKERRPDKPKKNSYRKYPPKPQKDSEEFTPQFTFFEKIFRFKRDEKIKKYNNKYENAILRWENEKKIIDDYNKNIDLEYKAKLKEWEKEIADWERQKKLFYKQQEEYNNRIEHLKNAYFKKDVNAVIEYCEMVLNNSEYPDFFPKNFELEYNPENGILIVEYQLPSIEDFPTLKEVKYIAARNELKEIHISQSQLNKIYDNTIYKIALRTIHELFEADQVDALDAISLNGWVKTIDRSKGKEVTNCILSIHVKKDEFLDVNLSKVDPKICFKSLKGVAGSKLSNLTPVKPIMQLTKTDKRFVNSYEVVDNIDDSTNLAAMDWEDFEHLIRELFEKEFKTSGGEVKVTRASRDGGVDAIAFDPDPIRGGKIVIQAKRYTNTVGVAAVRDLYGTVVNEGAIKGILVTTADYGSDAYEFAKDKPLTLLNGANLLQMLEKHGYHARIDIKEAKRILSEKNRA